jgi:hypothetical protein
MITRGVLKEFSILPSPYFDEDTGMRPLYQGPQLNKVFAQKYQSQ